jgi:hypothetical protein
MQSQELDGQYSDPAVMKYMAMHPLTQEQGPQLGSQMCWSESWKDRQAGGSQGSH